MTSELSAALDRVKTWVAEMNAAKEHDTAARAKLDKQSLDRAADLDRLYDAMQWPDQLPKPKRMRLGRPVDLRSRARFAQWVKQETGWGSQQTIARLHDALTFYTTNELGVETTEGALRPLFRLRKEGYGDHMLTVWRQAVSAANGHPTAKDTRAAVKAFLDAHRPPARTAAITRNRRTEAERQEARKNKILDLYRELLADGNQILARDTGNAIIRLYEERNKALKEAGL